MVALQVKQTKCAVFYERSGVEITCGIDQRPISSLLFTILDQPIRVYSRHETYSYLGHKFNIAGEWSQQVTDMAHQFISSLNLIDASPLPVVMKLQAVRDIAFSTIQHQFTNTQVLREMDSKTVEEVRKWLYSFQAQGFDVVRPAILNQ